jgi:hypothetical protein
MSATQPFCIFFTDKHRALESLCPFQMRRIVMWVADYDRFQASFALNPLDCLVIEKRYAIP